MKKMNEQYQILLVEDEPVVVDSASRILGSEGFQVDAVADVNAAIEKLQQTRYRLAISDLMLPNLSGIELVEKVKKIDPEIPVIIITGYANLENAIKSFKVGAFDFLPKPFDFEELIAVVLRAISYADLAKHSMRGAERIVRITRERIDDSEKEKYYFLGEHSWAKIEGDGAVSVGVAESFVNTMGKIHRIEMPFPRAEVWQGNLCVRIIARNDLAHIVWAPLSGQVIGVNADVEQNGDLINTNPFDRGWLFKMIPTNMASELANLDQLKNK